VPGRGPSQAGGEVLVEAAGLRLAHSGGRGGGQDKWPLHRGEQPATGRGALAKQNLCHCAKVSYRIHSRKTITSC